MERAGIAADVAWLAELEARFAGEVKRAADQAYSTIGHEVNLGSPKQLQQVLFEELGLPKTKKIKTGYTTDADALQDLYVKTEHPFLEHLLRHRDVARLKTVVDSLIPMIDDARAGPHDVQPAGRRDRPAVEHRPQPAEHPGPHARGPRDPQGLRRRRRASSAC